MGNAEQPCAEPSGVLKFFKVLIRFEKHVLTQIQSVLPVPHQPQQVVVDALLPSRDEQVEAFDIPPPRLRDQVTVFHLAKDQGTGRTPLTPDGNDAPGRQKVDLADNPSLAGVNRGGEVQVDPQLGGHCAAGTVEASSRADSGQPSISPTAL